MAQCFCYPTVENCEACEAAERYARTEVLACQSHLVDDLLKTAHDLGTQSGMDISTSFDLEEIENLFEDRCPECGEECFQGVEEEEPDLWTCSNQFCTWMGDPEPDSEPVEIYEWWLVTKWLADQLRKDGQPILDNDYGIWWGRCTTGQSMVMDGVLQRVYRNSQEELAELLKKD